MTPDRSLTGLLAPEAGLHRLADRLAERFVGVFARQTIDRLTDDVVQAADVVVTMGCGEARPIYPGKRYLNWRVRDPAGASLGQVRAIRAELDQRVRALLAEQHVTSSSP